MITLSPGTLPAPAPQAGPGALRGIKKCFEDPGDYTPAPEPVRLFFPPKWDISGHLPEQPAPTERTLTAHKQEALF